ncbi:MAG: CopG family transcriptional regulator [Burkholderiales bacterium]|nr:CopG family transcriptional regulator [Burkholderiales bacterium]
MRTTLDIEDDVLAAAKDMARREHLTAGQVISRLARLALTARVDQQQSATTVSGFRPLPARGVVVTNDQVNALREREGI